MKAMACAIVMSATVALFGLTMVGCESGNQSTGANYDTRTAGGNGAFGETPAKPGRYQDPTVGSPQPADVVQPAKQ